MKIVGLVAAALAALLLAACSSSSTGVETISGSTTSTANNPTVPLTASGVFSDTGSISLGGKGTKSFLKFSQGKLAVTHTNPSSLNNPSSINNTTCRVVFAGNGTFTVTGNGTGPYKGASGHGKFAVTFAATFPKLASGKCNLSNSANPLPGTSLTTFKATGNITIQ